MARSLKSQIRRLIATRPVTGWTCDELEIATGASHQSLSARLHELEVEGGAFRNPQYRRATRSGRTATAYVKRHSRARS